MWQTLSPTNIVLWTTALIGIGTIIASVVRFFFWLFDEIRKRRLDGHAAIPRETLRIALKLENAYWWHMGGIGADPAMQVVAEFFVTNISHHPTRILQIELRHGLLGRTRVNGMAMVHGDIDPGATADTSAMFWIVPPVKKPNEPFFAHSVVFRDQFGNGHRVRKLKFRCT